MHQDIIKDVKQQALTMLRDIQLQYKQLLENSSTSGFVWEQSYFNSCDGFDIGEYTWACFTLLCFLIGLPAALVVLWEMLKIQRRGTAFTPSELFILNITIMDVIFLAFLLPGLLNHFFLKIWAIEAFWNLLYALNTCGRPFLMACICFDCYLAVVHPIFYHKNKSLTPRAAVVAVVWTLTAANGVTFLLFYWLYFSFFSAVIYSIPIVIFVFCDGAVVYTLVKSDPVGKQIHPQKQRAIQTLSYSLAMTVVSYLPPLIAFSAMRSLAVSYDLFVCTVGFPITITSSLGSTIMPVLYLYNVGKLNWVRLGCCKH